MKASRRHGHGTAQAGGRHPARARLPLAILLLLPGPALATAFNYEIGLGIRHDDNINLSEDEPESENVVFGSLKFTARKESPKLDMRARGNLRYLNYLGGTYDDEIRGELSGQVDWTILPNRLHWVAEDYLSRQAVDILGSPDPGNQQQVNIFMTGPSLLFRLGRHNVAQVDVRYMNTYAEETKSFNGNRLIARASLLRELSPTTVASFNLEGSKSEFDEDATANDYKRWDAYFTVQRKLPALRLKADLGYTRIKPENSGESSSSPLLRAAVDWSPRGRHTFTGRADYQIADAAQHLIRRSSDLANETYSSTLSSTELLDSYDTLGNGSLVIGAEAYRERRVDVGYRYDGDRFTLRFHPYVHRVRYLENLNPLSPDLDRNSRGEAVSIDYKLRPTLGLSVSAYNQDVRYPSLDRKDDLWGVNVALTDRSARNWRWRLELGHGRRESSIPGESYKDNIIAFSITRYR